MMPRALISRLALAACLVHAAGALAQAPIVDPRDLDERLKRIEKLIGTDSLFKLFEEVESLNAETRKLRGQLEEASHTINQLQQRQRELYLDVDQRIRRLESATPTQTAAPSSQPPASAGAPAAPTQPATGPAAEQLPVTPAATPTTRAAPATEADTDAEKQAYQSALDVLKSGRYEEAATAFRRFIMSYPTGSYADNAQYWLGETYYVTRRYELALEEYQRLISTYPSSRKLTGALLKIGYSHYELGNRSEAERALVDLVERHPQSAAAGLARKRLQSIRQ